MNATGGIVVLQAAEPGHRVQIFNLPCADVDEARATAEHLLGTGRDLGMLRIQVDGETVEELL